MKQASVSEYTYVLSLGEKLGEYADEWIAVVDSKVIARGRTAKEVYEAARTAYPKKVPFIMKVPTDKIMVL